MKIAYCDCFSGVSGDMFLAALIDAGVPISLINESMHRLNLVDQIQVGVEKVKKGAIQASQLVIQMEEQEHTHRHYPDIIEMISDSQLSEESKEASLAIFKKLAEAEAYIHGTNLDEVHFHEVGAIDSILDIVGAAVGLEYLGIERLFSSAVPIGSGRIQTQHGILPLPAPATLKLLSYANAKVVPSGADNVELVTPTGAAILATLATFEQPSMIIHDIGTGAGKRELPWPNIFRLIIGEIRDDISQPLSVLETNIDDMNPQNFGYVMEKLFAAGALDVFFTPIQMKKNRPATMLSIIARRVDEPLLANLILRETSSLGIRVYPIYRYEAQRKFIVARTEYGDIPVKVKLIDGEKPQAAPEFEACAQIAREHNIPLLEVYQLALKSLDAI